MIFHAIRAFWRVLTGGYPRMTVDRDTGAIYVYVRPGVVGQTVDFEIDPDDLPTNINADFTEDGDLLGIEILP